MANTKMIPALIFDSVDLGPNIVLSFILREVQNYSTDVNVNVSSNVSLKYTSNDRTISVISFYLKLIIICIGILGNSISVMAFFRSRLGTGTVAQYLISLALADNIVLASEIPICVALFPLQYEIIHKYDWLCRITYYSRYTGRIWSACLTLIVTVERYLFVAHPLKKVYIQNHHMHRILIPITLFISLVCVCYSLLLIQVQPYNDHENVCFVSDEHRTLFFALDLVIVRGVGDLIMGVCIMIFTVLCINVLHKASKIRKNSIQERSSLCLSCGNQTYRVHKKNYKSRESQITKMLLMLVVMFLIFKVPYTVFYYSTLISFGKGGQNMSPVEVVVKGAKTISETFALISYAFNFFIYVLLIPSFRNKLCFIFKCKCSDCTIDFFKIQKKEHIPSLMQVQMP